MADVMLTILSSVDDRSPWGAGRERRALTLDVATVSDPYCHYDPPLGRLRHRATTIESRAKESAMITSAMRGTFKEDSRTRNEFLDLAR